MWSGCMSFPPGVHGHWPDRGRRSYWILFAAVTNHLFQFFCNIHPRKLTWHLNIYLEKEIPIGNHHFYSFLVIIQILVFGGVITHASFWFRHISDDPIPFGTFQVDHFPALLVVGNMSLRFPLVPWICGAPLIEVVDLSPYPPFLENFLRHSFRYRTNHRDSYLNIGEVSTRSGGKLVWFRVQNLQPPSHSPKPPTSLNPDHPFWISHFWTIGASFVISPMDQPWHLGERDRNL